MMPAIAVCRAFCKGEFTLARDLLARPGNRIDSAFLLIPYSHLHYRVWADDRRQSDHEESRREVRLDFLERLCRELVNPGVQGACNGDHVLPVLKPMLVSGRDRDETEHPDYHRVDKRLEVGALLAPAC